MASKLNQHFVPQYLFRLFSGGKPYISLITKWTSRTVPCASIKGQCARHKYYGNTEVEDLLAKYDGRHAVAYRAVLREAWTSSSSSLSTDELYWLYEGLLLQRSRVPRTATILASGTQHLAFLAFGNYLKAKHNHLYEPFAHAVRKGQATLRNNDTFALLHSIVIGLQSVIGISDLMFVVLRNYSSFPFIFSDAPCVFYNRYLFHRDHRGALGLTNPGLMIFMPLDSKTQVMLYDANTYHFVGNRPFFIDLINNFDVSQLNALQAVSAVENVYVDDLRHAEYVTDLLNAHRAAFAKPSFDYRTFRPGTALIDDKPNDREAFCYFEGQLPITLDLSFLETRPIADDEEPPRYRDRGLRDELHEALNGSGGTP